MPTALSAGHVLLPVHLVDACATQQAGPLVGATILCDIAAAIGLLQQHPPGEVERSIRRRPHGHGWHPCAVVHTLGDLLGNNYASTLLQLLVAKENVMLGAGFRWAKVEDCVSPMAARAFKTNALTPFRKSRW